MPLAFERENAEQVFGWVSHVGAFTPRCAFGNPEQPEQTHHVIHPQSTGMPETRADQLDEIAIPIIPKGARIDRRETPVLPEIRIRIRWRANRHAFAEELT